MLVFDPRDDSLCQAGTVLSTWTKNSRAAVSTAAPELFCDQKLCLLQGGVSCTSGGTTRHGGSHCGEANHSVFVRAEAAHTGLVN